VDVNYAARSPDGRRVALCGADHTARIWDASMRAPTTPPLPHRAPVRYAAFSPDGRRLLTLSDDRTARLWDASSGELLAVSLKSARAIRRGFFRGEGSEVVLVHEEGAPSTWDLRPDRRPVAEILALAEVLAGAHINGKQQREIVEESAVRAAWSALHPAPQ
jgi:WD40 repeat protein